MKHIILDMEWNQSFASKKMIRKGIPLEGEIVQIGAVRLDEDYHVLDTFKIMVKPKYYTKMHGKVSRLTKIQTADLQFGFPFPVALGYFQKWCGDDFVFLTWGSEDIDVLRDNLLLHKLDTGWLPLSFDLQAIFDNQVTKLGRQVSLADAVKVVGELPWNAHDALCDAMCTARMCLHLDMEKGLAEYSTLRENNPAFVRKPLDRVKTGKTYPTRAEAFQDKTLTRFFVRPLGRMAVCSDIVRQKNDKFICIAKCDNGEELFVRFKFSKAPNDSFSVARLVYELEEGDRELYNAKANAVVTAQEPILQQAVV